MTRLKHVVQVSNSNLRQSDKVSRYGGEEFIFFFADATLEQGICAAERIRSAIAATPVPLGAGSAFLSVSIGISGILLEWRAAYTSIFLQNIIAQADDAREPRLGSGQRQREQLKYPKKMLLESGAGRCARV